MAEVLQGDQREKENDNCDFQNWSPADLMAFVERTLPGPAHKAAVDTIRTLGLDGDFISELIAEPRPFIPIRPASYRRLRTRALLILLSFVAEKRDVQYHDNHGNRLKNVVRLFLSAEVEKRRLGGEMGGATLVGPQDDDIEVVLDDIVRLQSALEIDSDVLARLAKMRTGEGEDWEHARFARSWVTAVRDENRRIRRGESPHQVLVPLFRNARPQEGGVEEPGPQRDPEREQEEMEQEPLEPQMAPQDPVEEPRPQTPGEPEPVLEEMEQEPVLEEDEPEPESEAEEEEEMNEEQDEPENAPQRLEAEPRAPTPDDHEGEEWEEEDWDDEEMERGSDEEVDEEEIIRNRQMAEIARAIRILARRIREHNALIQQEEVIGERIRRLEETLARGGPDIDEAALRREILRLHVEGLQMLERGHVIYEEGVRDADELLENGDEQPDAPNGQPEQQEA